MTAPKRFLLCASKQVLRLARDADGSPFAAPLLPEHKPRYLMGVGTPADIVEAVARGIDMFDCVLPTRNARNGLLFTSQGRVVIKHARFERDPRPLDETCGCYTCRNYSRAYLRHLYMTRELLAYRVNTLHNVHYYLNLVINKKKCIFSNSLFPLKFR